jgi:small subunit ribosomal protein S15
MLFENPVGIRLPKKERGRSHSIRPVSKRPPSWCEYTPEDVKTLVVELAKEGHTPSKIGIILRDKYAVPLVKHLTGKKITEILKEMSLAPSIPEDLDTLLKKASRLRTHLEKNKTDFHNKRALQIVESKIYKLAKYYKQEELLPQSWKYEPEVATFK